jgi:hypothetical protein
MRKAYLLVLTSVILIAVGMLAPTLVTAQYDTTTTGPVIAVELPNGTQDMNITNAHPYAIGDKYNVTVWINNVTQLDGFGLTVFWNSSLTNMTAFSWSNFMIAEKNAGNWTFSPTRGPGTPGYPYGIDWTNNATLMSGKPWTGLIPYNIGAILGIGGGTASDAAPLTGNIEICVLTFQIKKVGPHWYYIDKDPSNYGSTPSAWPTPYLSIEAEFAAVHFPYCLVELAPGATVSNYGVAWCKNPYFAPPTPLSGSVLNAMLLTYTPPSAPVATITYTPASPHFNQTVTVTVTQTSAGYNGTATCPITNVTINFGDSSPRQWKAPVSGVATFTHNYTTIGLYTINAYCYAAHMPSNLAWSNKTASPPVNVIPEFSAYLLTPLFLATTIIAVAVAKMWSKKPKKPR